MSQDITNQVTQLVNNVLQDASSKVALGPDCVLMESGLDSFAIVELILSLETTFNVKFEPADWVIEHFQTIRSLVSMIQAKLDAQ